MRFYVFPPFTVARFDVFFRLQGVHGRVSSASPQTALASVSSSSLFILLTRRATTDALYLGLYYIV